MIGRLFIFTLGSLMWTQAACADMLILSNAGTFLGRLNTSDINSPVHITVDLAGDDPVATYVMARFQNNTPYSLIPNGDWESWSEKETDLVDTEFAPNLDGTLTFEILDEIVSLDYLPVIFTVAYSIEDGSLKSGYLVIDQ
jgi:hypothetical protein